MSKNTAILGAGLVGSLLSVFLSKRGYKVTIYERRPDMRKEDVGGGRSINLALSDRGWHALRKAGIEDVVRKVAIPMHGRFIHNLDGTTAFQPYGKEGQAIYSVSRAELNMVMMSEAEKYGANIQFNSRCTGVNLDKNEILLETADGARSISADLIFGADGAFSAARLSLQLTDRYNYSQHYLEHGYKELCIEAAPDGSHVLEKNALHIWPRGGFMLIALPNMDGSFTCTLFFAHEGENSFAALNTESKAEDFFRKTFPDAFPLMHNLKHDFFHNPTGSLVTVKCFPWSWKNRAVLIGDAAHAIVPFYGQGMNCGFEDCRILDGLIEKHSNDWNKIVPEYEMLRKPAGDAIAELAVQNFIEMRDLVGDKNFLLRKKIEAQFSQKHPDKWIPLYSMVTFSDMPYNEALHEGKKQDRIMAKIMERKNIESEWGSREVEEQILDIVSQS